MDSTTMNIEFDNLTYTVTNPSGNNKTESKRVLDSISGCFKSGELTAIMGPSGAGKSTLLNILTGFTRIGVAGTINMKDIKMANKQLSRNCSYILQEDNLYSDFTVQETMWLAASLKIGQVDLENKQQIINNILDSLHLHHTKRTKCGSLSGGQRKRLSIALELLDNRPILILDEPTTGLDSLSATHCMRLLHNLAHEGRTIVCTIHQPAATVYELFDQVYVLAAGRCIYQGSADNTVAYLSSNGLQCPKYHNSADFLLEVANCEYGNFTKLLASSALDTRWRQPVHTASHHMPAAIEPTTNTMNVTHRPPSEWKKFVVLVKRCHIHYHRDWTVTYLKWFLHVFIAVSMGLLYGDSGTNATKSIANLSLLGACNMYMWYTAIMPAVLKFPNELAIIKKETFNHWYKLRTYFMANMLVTAPIHIIFATTFSTVVYLMTDQPLESDRFLKYTLIYVLINIIGDSIGLTIGAIFDPINGTFVGAILSVYKIALCGFVAMPSQVSESIRGIMHMSSLNYSMEALVLSLYEHNRTSMVCPTSEMYCHFVSPSEIIKLIGFSRGNYCFDVLILAVQLVLFKMVAYYALRVRVKK